MSIFSFELSEIPPWFHCTCHLHTDMLTWFCDSRMSPLLTCPSGVIFHEQCRKNAFFWLDDTIRVDCLPFSQSVATILISQNADYTLYAHALLWSYFQLIVLLSGTSVGSDPPLLLSSGDSLFDKECDLLLKQHYLCFLWESCSIHARSVVGGVMTHHRSRPDHKQTPAHKMFFYRALSTGKRDCKCEGTPWEQEHAQPFVINGCHCRTQRCHVKKGQATSKVLRLMWKLPHRASQSRLTVSISYASDESQKQTVI